MVVASFHNFIALKVLFALTINDLFNLLPPIIGVINLNLPISVLTSESTIIRKGGIDRDTGTLLLIIELTAYESAYTVQRKPIVFEEI